MAAEPVCLACGALNVVPWARAHDVEYHAVADHFDYVRCAACDTLSIVDPPRDRLHDIYPSNYYSFSEDGLSVIERVKQWFDSRQFSRLFAMVDGQTLSALDVGGGAGWLLTFAKSFEPRLVDTMVVDLDDAAETRARAAGHDFFLGPVENFETDKRFDVIFMLNLIEHVADPVAVLTKMRALLAPGGVIFVKTPNHDSLDARLFRNHSWGGLHAPRHWVIFTPESFAKAATKANLVVTKSTLTQGAPFWTVSTLELLGRWGLVRISAQKPMVNHPLFGLLNAGFAVFDMVRGSVMRTSQMFITLRAR